MKCELPPDSGWIALYRKLLNSRVFQNEGLLKVWIWCLLKATHKEIWMPVKIGRGFTEVHLLPGQFIFGRKSAAKELKMNPETIRKRIDKLKNMQNITIESTTQYSVITLANWEVYQTEEKKVTPKEHQKRKKSNSDSSPKILAAQGICQTEEKKVPPKKQKKEHKQEVFILRNINTVNFSVEILSLRKRYPDQNLIDKAYNAIRSTRKFNKIADSVWLRILKDWQKYPIRQVEVGIRVYLEKEYYKNPTMKESYLLGIIRNREEETTKCHSTGSSLLDAISSADVITRVTD